MLTSKPQVKTWFKLVRKKYVLSVSTDRWPMGLWDASREGQPTCLQIYIVSSDCSRVKVNAAGSWALEWPVGPELARVVWVADR